MVRAAPGDPDLGDGAWMRIAGEIMHRTGLSRYGEEDEGVRWVAVHHGDNHIHMVATLARQDGRRVRLDNDWYRIGEALRDIEAEYGLQVVARYFRVGNAEQATVTVASLAGASRHQPLATPGDRVGSEFQPPPSYSHTFAVVSSHHAQPIIVLGAPLSSCGPRHNAGARRSTG